jgi:hypothetical protein
MSLDDQVQLALAAIMLVGLAVLAVRQLAQQKPSLIEGAGEWLYWMAGMMTALAAIEML